MSGGFVERELAVARGLASCRGDDARLDEADAEIAKLRAENDALRADAERYRLLRRGQKWSVIDGNGETLRAETLDAAIDAAREVK